MQSKVLIFCGDRLGDLDIAIAKLIKFLGIDYEYMHLNTFPDYQLVSDDTPGDILAGAISCQELANIDRRGFIDRFKSFLGERISYLLIYGIYPGAAENSALNTLTDGLIDSVLSFENSNYSYKISENFMEICKHFSGISFGPINNEVDCKVNFKEDFRGVDHLVLAGGHPLFSKMRIGICTVFLLASNKVLDIEQNLLEKANIQNYFSRIVPVMMFIKYVFKNSCWHNDTDQACLIIDDPLLKRNYGFLNYEELLKTMKRHNFSSSIAFIPWNYKRTNPRIAELFREHPDRFSLCVHGSNHTKSEFGSTDEKELNNAAKLAEERMKYHENTTGLMFDKVMVFPQGKFSTKSMKILKSNNYLASVNYEILPTDFLNPLPVSCLLEPAITNIENFPLLHRRHPDDTLGFAFDLFCGKPALIMVHHYHFREGYDKIGTFIEKINALNENIQWRKLGDIIERSYLQKYEDDNTVSLRVYSTRTAIENPSDNVITYLVTKHETGNVPIKAVNINGERVPFEIDNQSINVSIQLKPKDKARFEIVYQDSYPDYEKNHNAKEDFKIFVRRHLSEIRDNYISKNKRLLSLLNRKTSNPEVRPEGKIN